MSDNKTPEPGEKALRDQADEKNGKIKSAQQTDRSMPDKDTARGSEPARHARK